MTRFTCPLDNDDDDIFNYGATPSTRSLRGYNSDTVSTPARSGDVGDLFRTRSAPPAAWKVRVGDNYGGRKQRFAC